MAHSKNCAATLELLDRSCIEGESCFRKFLPDARQLERDLILLLVCSCLEGARINGDTQVLFHLLIVGEGPAGDLLTHRFADEISVTRAEVGSFWSEPEERPFDLAVVAKKDLPANAGRAIARIRGLSQKPEVAVWSPCLNESDVLSLQAAGCYAVIPVGSHEEPIVRVFERLIHRRREALMVAIRDRQIAETQRSEEVICQSPATRQVLQIAARVAVSDTSLLILGETGTGKEWLARQVHLLSPRAAGPFIPVNCGAIPDSLMESELFGHEKGAFTGASRVRRGYFERAHGGTLFLDEIGEMPPHLQVRLLRVLQDRSVQRLGGEGTLSIDTRVVAATHRDLKKENETGRFRKDLYYRLAVVTVTMPPLRERPEEIVPLAERYLDIYRGRLARPDLQGFTADALTALRAYPWPGNVRELINVVERAVLLADGPEVGLLDLPIDLAPPLMGSAATPRPLDDLTPWLNQPLEVGRLAVVTDFERRYLTDLLTRNRGHLGRTAREAGIDPRTLYNKMQRLGMQKKDFRE